jgi:hypothetical protein
VGLLGGELLASSLCPSVSVTIATGRRVPDQVWTTKLEEGAE